MSLMSPGLLAKGPAVVQQGQRATRAGQASQRGTSPVAWPPNLSFLWVRLQGQEVCPTLWAAPRQAGEVAEDSFPTPRGTHSSGRGSAGRLHHSPSPTQLWLPRTQKRPLESHTGPGREKDLATQSRGAQKTGAPHTRSLGLPKTGPLPSYSTMAQYTPDIPAPYT